MNIFAGIPSKANEESPDSTSVFPVRVDIAIEHPCYFRGEVIASDVPLLPLKETAPRILRYLTIDGAQIVLPCSEAIDQGLLLNLIDLIVDQHRSGEDFDIDVHELPLDPVKLIKLHIMLELFGLSHQAHDLMESLWVVFKTHTLTLTDVFWIWGALVPHRSIKWVPESTDAYMRMMKWNLLNSDVEGRLHPELRTFFLEDEGRPYHLTCLLEQHYLEHGLSREPQGAPRKRRDTATELTEDIAPFCSLPNPVSSSTSMRGPIFPGRWLSPPESKERPNFTDAFFINEKWDGKLKNVREMAAERDELVTLRRKQAFLYSTGDSLV